MSDRLLPPEPHYCPDCDEEMVEDTNALELVCPRCIVGTPCPVTDLAHDHIHAPHVLTWDAAAQTARCPMCIVEWLGCTMAVDFDEYPEAERNAQMTTKDYSDCPDECLHLWCMDHMTYVHVPWCPHHEKDDPEAGRREERAA